MAPTGSAVWRRGHISRNNVPYARRWPERAAAGAGSAVTASAAPAAKSGAVQVRPAEARPEPCHGSTVAIRHSAANSHRDHATLLNRECHPPSPDNACADATLADVPKCAASSKCRDKPGHTSDLPTAPAVTPDWRETAGARTTPRCNATTTNTHAGG